MVDIIGGGEAKAQKMYDLTVAAGYFAIDLSKYAAFNFRFTCVGSEELTLSNPPIGVSVLRFLITDGGAATDLVMPTIHEAGGTELTFTASGLDYLELTCINDGTTVTYYQTNLLQAIAD